MARRPVLYPDDLYRPRLGIIMSLVEQVLQATSSGIDSSGEEEVSKKIDEATAVLYKTAHTEHISTGYFAQALCRTLYEVVDEIYDQMPEKYKDAIRKTQGPTIAEREEEDENEV